VKNWAWEFFRCAIRCALRGEWRAALMYLRTAKAQLGPPRF
jgi:hypothetical protein